MILRTHLASIVATALTSVALPLCLPSLGLMIAWLAWFCVYLGILLLGALSLELVEERHLPRPLGDELLFPPHYTERTNVAGAPPFRFVGLSEKGRALDQHNSKRVPPEDIQ